jgi:hypothetical protein
VGTLRSDVNAYRVSIRKHLLAGTPEAKDAAEKKMIAGLDAIAKDRKTYEPMISSPEERAIYNDWAKAWGSYHVGAEQVTARLQRGRQSPIAPIQTESVSRISSMTLPSFLPERTSTWKE